MATNSFLDSLSVKSNPSTTSLTDAKTGSGAAAASTTLAKDYTTFIKLLTAQLKNQDPTEPLDTNQMTQQLATFAGVEQQIATNKNLESLLSNMSGSQMQQMVNYIGKSVEAVGGQSELKNGTAPFGYEIPVGASEVTLSVVDSAGKAVFTVQPGTEAGRHGFVWDGTNNFTGQKMPDGVYKLAVVAKDAKEKTLATKTYTIGTVTAVESEGNGAAPVLKLGKVSLKLSDVLKVAEPANTQTAATQ